MSLAWYISTERDISGLDTSVDGKSIAHASEGKLAAIVEELGIRHPMDFFSTSLEEVEGLIGESLGDAGDMPSLSEEDWFSAEEGLNTVRPLLAYLREKEGELDHQEEIIFDLKEYERILAVLAKEGVRWHMSIDI